MNPVTEPTKMQKTKEFVFRWQESTVWMPLLVLLSLGAWIVLGAMDKNAAVDTLPLVVVLPIKVAYAMAALALTHLARRRWRMRLSTDEQSLFWRNLQAGDRGPMLVFALDAVFTLCALYFLLRFFTLPS